MTDFIKYFTGLKRNYGFCNINNGYKDPNTGKIKFHSGDYGWSGKPITEEDYRLHLHGRKSIGIQPCDDNGYARFGAIDIDPKIYKDLDIQFYLDTIQKNNLPLIPIKSKSNGLHLYIFTKEFVLFLNCIELNKMTSEQLKQITNKIIQNELTGGAEEFKDGPPCLEILSKEKMTDGRDRFLYNYMVFAKKKYPDNWGKMVLKAGRNYFEFDEVWTDDHIEKKIKHWEKQEKGHSCHDPLLAPVCVKSECVKRDFGIMSDKKITWPRLSNLIKVDFKPDPEYYFDVERDDGETVTVHAKDVNKIKDQQELRSLIMAQADDIPPPIKGMEFYEIIKALVATQDTVQPAPGTTPMEILKKHLKQYIHSTNATSYNSFKSGNVLKDETYAYFVFDEFFNDLKDNEWRKDASRTSYMITKMFEKEAEHLPKPDFDVRKRFPGKDKKTNKPYTGIPGCAKIPLYLFDDKEEDVIEVENFEREEIV